MGSATGPTPTAVSTASCLDSYAVRCEHKLADSLSSIAKFIRLKRQRIAENEYVPRFFFHFCV